MADPVSDAPVKTKARVLPKADLVGQVAAIKAELLAHDTLDDARRFFGVSILNRILELLDA